MFENTPPEDVHNYRKGTSDEHTASRDCPCDPVVMRWGDGAMVVHDPQRPVPDGVEVIQ